MSSIIPFTFPDTGQPVRTVTVDSEPWWFASDVCAVLGIANVGNVIARLDDADVSSIRLTDGTPGNPNRAIVNESGLYDLILDSRKPEARRFRRWITSEVIPSIRKTGRYEARPAAQLTKRDLARMVIEEADRADAAEKKVAELEPMAEAGRAFTEAEDGARLVGAVAKNLKMPEHVLRRFLLDERFIFPRYTPRGRRYYEGYANHVQAGHIEHAEHTHLEFGSPVTTLTVYLTQRGQALVLQRLNRRNRQALEAGATVLQLPTGSDGGDQR